MGDKTWLEPPSMDRIEAEIDRLHDRIDFLHEEADELLGTVGQQLVDKADVLEARGQVAVTKGPTGIIHMPGGQEYNRREFDFYPTPLALCGAALSLLPEDFDPKWVMDPGAGDGPWGKAAIIRWPYAHLYGVDVRDIPNPLAIYDYWKPRTDYLKLSDTNWENNEYDLVMGNPPFSQKKELGPTNLAEMFVRAGYASLLPGGYMVFLLRLAFLESQERGGGLWKEIPPKEVHVCSERPSFMPTGHPKEGKTDATAYGRYVWQKGWTGQTTLSWLKWK